MKRPLIKMCGITSAEDARDAVAAGADLVGLNFWPGSPRAVSFGQAVTIAAAVRRLAHPRRPAARARVVAVFVDAHEDLVQGVLEHVKPDILQFHGDETPEQCARHGHRFIKAFRLRGAQDVDGIPRYLGEPSVGYLVDAFSPTSPGGTGRMLRTELARLALAHPRGFLAGGLTPENVGAVVRQLAPFGVDVASGIETRPGVKSTALMSAFVRAVEAAVTG